MSHFRAGNQCPYQRLRQLVDAQTRVHVQMRPVLYQALYCHLYLICHLLPFILPFIAIYTWFILEFKIRMGLLTIMLDVLMWLVIRTFILRGSLQKKKKIGRERNFCTEDLIANFWYLSVTVWILMHKRYQCNVEVEATCVSYHCRKNIIARKMKTTFPFVNNHNIRTG